MDMALVPNTKYAVVMAGARKGPPHVNVTTDSREASASLTGAPGSTVAPMAGVRAVEAGSCVCVISATLESCVHVCIVFFFQNWI